MNKNVNKLQTRDFISVGIFSLIYAAVAFIIGGVAQMDTHYLSLYAADCRPVYRDRVCALCGEDTQARRYYDSRDYRRHPAVYHGYVLDDVRFFCGIRYHSRRHLCLGQLQIL